jgi:hypothetical protein
LTDVTTRARPWCTLMGVKRRSTAARVTPNAGAELCSHVILGGDGNDNVTCGPGNDFVVADSLDVLAADCEHVEFPVAPPE